MQIDDLSVILHIQTMVLWKTIFSSCWIWYLFVVTTLMKLVTLTYMLHVFHVCFMSY